MPTYRHVNHLWDDAKAPADPVDQLIYRSNILGADQRITNTGGGNTSSKIASKDPLTGEQVDVMWVKGSGGDLRTSKRENFAALYMGKLLGLQSAYLKDPKKGLKTEAEDKQVNNYRHCTFNLRRRSTRRCTASFRAGTSITRIRTLPSRSRPQSEAKNSRRKSSAMKSAGCRGCARASSSAC